METPFFRFFTSLKDVKQALTKLGVESTGIKLMAPKMFLATAAIPEMDVRAMNILKQEALAIGADVALPKTAAMFKHSKEKGIFIGNAKQLAALIGKLQTQPFGLAEFGRKLKILLDRLQPENHVVPFLRGKRKISKPLLMGILNVTPDSFSDGGEFANANDAVARAKQMIEEGADIIDIGGESTGPGSKDVSLQEEKRRVFSVFEKVRKFSDTVLLSIDTWKSEIAKEAIRLGADMVNDVTALRGDPKMAKVCASAKVPVCLMYAKDKTSRTTRKSVQYDDVMATILQFLHERIEYAKAQGISEDHIIVDPGMGAFISGDPKYSFEVIRRFKELQSLGRPILISPSMKSYLGGKLEERREGSLAACAACAIAGASIVRMHDIQESRRVLSVVEKL